MDFKKRIEFSYVSVRSAYRKTTYAKKRMDPRHNQSVKRGVSAFLFCKYPPPGDYRSSTASSCSSHLLYFCFKILSAALYSWLFSSIIIPFYFLLQYIKKKYICKPFSPFPRLSAFAPASPHSCPYPLVFLSLLWYTYTCRQACLRQASSANLTDRSDRYG